MSGATSASRGRVRARAEDDGVPEHLKCSVCLDAPWGRIEQCANGEPIYNSVKRLSGHLFGTLALTPLTRVRFCLRRRAAAHT